MIKSTIEELAIFGGAPAFVKPLHVGQPDACNRQALFQRLAGVLDRRWLTNDGPLVQEFEREVQARLQVKHCIATSSGTIALEMIMRALALAGEIILPAFTFIGTAHAVRWSGLTPVFCDIDPQTHNLDAGKVKEAVSERTSAILGVHLWGRPCEVDELADIAETHQVKLIFDAAHAFGCSYQGTPIGNFGSAEALSFHATKIVTTFEGGAVVTNNDELANRVRLMRNFGFSNYDKVSCLGINGKLSEAGAAMGLTSLESFEKRVSRNCARYRLYQQCLDGSRAINFAAYKESERNNFRYIVVEVDPISSQISRDNLLRVLQAENVLARRYFFPGCHRMEPYQTESENPQVLNETEQLANRVLVLPTGESVTANAVSEICDIVRLCVDNGPELTKRFDTLHTA